MSRPFSYNDENFTVIGNILFIHISLSGKAYNAGDKLVTIPQGIVNRMLTYSNIGILSNNYPYSGGDSIGIVCSDTGDLTTRSPINSASMYLPRYIYSYYPLKNI